MKPILIIDTGNSNIKIGIYARGELQHFWRFSTRESMLSEQLWSMMSAAFEQQQADVSQLEGVVISSVVPPLLPALCEVSETYLRHKPLVMGPGLKTGLEVATDQPASTGADRIAGAVAAVHRYGAPAIIISLGTATTISVVDEKRRFIGGAISPGGKISLDALTEASAQLSAIELTGDDLSIHKSTASSLLYGTIYGLAGQLDGIVERIQDELGGSCHVVASGGLSSIIAPHSRTIQYTHPDLVMEGLYVIWGLNR